MQALNLMPFVVWYVLPGLIMITVCIVGPELVLNLHGVAAVFTLDDLIAAAALSLVIGFIMDAVKLYRLTPRYERQKMEFHARLAEALGIAQTDVRKIFDIIRADVRAQDPSARTVELDHSRWVMINHSSKGFFLAVAVWLAVGAVHWRTASTVTYLGLLATNRLLWKLLIDFGLAGLSLIIGLRMQRVAYQVADASDMNYLIHVRRNAERLKAEIASFVREGDPDPEA